MDGYYRISGWLYKSVQENDVVVKGSLRAKDVVAKFCLVFWVFCQKYQWFSEFFQASSHIIEGNCPLSH